MFFFPPGLKGLGPFGQDERGAGSHDGRQKGVTLGQVEKGSEGKERKQNEQNQETIVEIKLFFALLFFLDKSTAELDTARSRQDRRSR